MQPSNIYEDYVGVEDLAEISRNCMVKATDGKSMVIMQFGKLLTEKGVPLEEKKKMTVALYEACKKVEIKGEKYFVQKMERVVSRDIKTDLDGIVKRYKDIIVEAFSKRAKNVVLLYRDGKLKFFEGEGSKLLKEKKAVFDVYSIIESSESQDQKSGADSELRREKLLQEYGIRDPSDTEIKRIIKNAFGD